MSLSLHTLLPTTSKSWGLPLPRMEQPQCARSPSPHPFHTIGIPAAAQPASPWRWQHKSHPHGRDRKLSSKAPSSALGHSSAPGSSPGCPLPSPSLIPASIPLPSAGMVMGAAGPEPAPVSCAPHTGSVIPSTRIWAFSAPKGPARGWEEGVALCYPLGESLPTLEEINLSPVGFATDKIPCTAT